MKSRCNVSLGVGAGREPGIGARESISVRKYKPVWWRR